MVESTSSGFGWETMRTPVPLLRCVGLTTTSPAEGLLKCSWTNLCMAAWLTTPSMLNKAGICGTPMFSNMRCSMSLSASACMVFFPMLISFMICMISFKSMRRVLVMLETSKSVFMQNSAAAAIQGLTSIPLKDCVISTDTCESDCARNDGIAGSKEGEYGKGCTACSRSNGTTGCLLAVTRIALPSDRLGDIPLTGLCARLGGCKAMYGCA
mmetsp:Transcript_47547/g.75206  ORF Transcript_47547/g.75206 Transcript_47547/m.75206 type:complete len:212 (+) Transcript_47547:1213-1848(+)